jgi:hypothetical protein
MQNIRIVNLPEVKAVYSGPLTDEEKFERFNNWFSTYHNSLKNELYPRDFMWYNERLGVQEWFYALPAGAKEEDCGGFEIVDLPSGLFAVASCLDADLDQAADWLNTREELIIWAEKSNKFKAYENAEGKKERYPMFHIVSPGELYEEGISVEDLYFPIERK